MGQGLPKPLRRVGGKTLLKRVVDRLIEAGIGAEHLIVVISPGLNRDAAGVELEARQWVVQAQARGTGDAARCGLGAISSAGNPMVVVALADVPFTATRTYRKLIQQTPESGLGFVTAVIEDPGELGRVLRNSHGTIEAIVEAREMKNTLTGISALQEPSKEDTPTGISVSQKASMEDKNVKGTSEINVGHFCGRKNVFLQLIEQIVPPREGGEIYLTEMVRLARRSNMQVASVPVGHPDEALAANTLDELKKLEEAQTHGNP